MGGFLIGVFRMGVFWIGSDGGGLGWRALGRGVSMGGVLI